ncbi:MAG: hypothetical protein QNJ32_13730 [Xenococcaceae cyanobacterium MO_167.B27]|nr:hypothetical protein [Xenococcaceae cyanobacterium MO_167.B27]
MRETYYKHLKAGFLKLKTAIYNHAIALNPTNSRYNHLIIKLFAINHEVKSCYSSSRRRGILGGSTCNSWLCKTQGDTFEEFLQNIYEAVEGCLSIDDADIQLDTNAQILEIAV